jgi:internalin A
MSELALRLIAENIKKHRRGEDATYLDLGNCGLTHLPAELGACVWLETLILSNRWSKYDLEEEDWVSKSSQNKGEPNSITSITGIERLTALKKWFIDNFCGL